MKLHHSNLRLQFFLQLALICFTPGVVSQNNGDVKLINGPSDYQGTVAVYYNKKWGTVCDDSWNYRDADVICRQLGFIKSKSIWYRARYGPGPGPIWVDQINCPSDADHILKCTPKLSDWGHHDCSKSEDAGVDCVRQVAVKPDTLPVRISCPEYQQKGSCMVCSDKLHPAPGECSKQAAAEGVVFAFYNKKWHPVSGEGFGLKEADIVCGELGYPLALGIPRLEELWSNWDGSYLNNCESETGSGESIGPTCTQEEILENEKYRLKLRSTLLKNLDCVGSERSLRDCHYSELGPHNKSNVNVATVRCGFKPHHTCNSNTTEVMLLLLKFIHDAISKKFLRV